MGDDSTAVSGLRPNGGERDGADAALGDHLFGRLEHAELGLGATLGLCSALWDGAHAGSDDQNDARARPPVRPSFSVIHQ